ncbi:transposase [Pedobacter steynii]
MKRLRQSTVEPVFGSLVHYYGLNKIGVIGKPGAHKVMLMSAIAFNLKKYMKFRVRKASDNLFKYVQKAKSHQYKLDNAPDQAFVISLN